MARGRLLKTKVKEAYAVSKASAKGTIQGEQEGHEKKTLMESAKEHIGLLIDRLSVSDAVCVGVGYIGYAATSDVRGALIGMLGYQLAMATGLPAQLAGVSILGALGLLSLGHGGSMLQGGVVFDGGVGLNDGSYDYTFKAPYIDQEITQRYSYKNYTDMDVQRLQADPKVTNLVNVKREPAGMGGGAR